MKMTGIEVYGQSHKHTRKPAPWIYLFDFASSVHRSLRVRATVFNCWPQTPPHPLRPPPPHLVPFENINSGKRSCLFAFSSPSPEMVHGSDSQAWERKEGGEEKGGGELSMYTQWWHTPKVQFHSPSLPERKKTSNQPNKRTTKE